MLRVRILADVWLNLILLSVGSVSNQRKFMEHYDKQWAENYNRLASIAIPGREGLYRLCAAYFQNLPIKAQVLVTGCGAGEELVMLAKALSQASFVAVDPSTSMFAHCQKRLE
ncbi:MAG: class I SAM-dependent methyltransferase [Pseudomonadales bacterium]|nr:class I SAM-dependent methyltransferase [Pseudomonadales bacterium]